VKKPDGKVKVMAVDDKHSMMFVNPTARQALYHPQRRGIVPTNGT